MAQVPATSYESTSLGDVAEFTIPFPFLSRAEVFVTVDGAPVAFTWINDGLVQLAAVPELGAIVRRYRSTAAYVPLHQFSQGVPFLPRYVDRDFKQTLYAVQESVNDTAGTAAQALAIAEESLVLVQDAFDILGERTQYMDLGPYAAGLEFQTTSQVFSYLGEFYAPGPSITLPYTTTGAGAAEIATFRSVGDAILRADLADPLKGADLVAFDESADYAAATVGARLKLLGNGVPTVFAFMTPAEIADVKSGSPVLDHTAAIQAAIYGTVGELSVGVEGFTFNVTRLVGRTKLHLSGIGTLDFSGNPTYASTIADPLFKIWGSAGPVVAVTAPIAQYATLIDVADTTGISPADLIEIATPGNNGDFVDTSVSVHNGEICQVLAVVSGTQLRLAEPVMDSNGYAPINSAQIRKLNTVDDVYIGPGVTIVGKGRPQPAGPGDNGLIVMYGRRVRVHCNFIRTDLACVRFEGCYDYEAAEGTYIADAQGANSTVNYGVVPSGSSKHGRVFRIKAANMRHAIVTSHLSIGLGLNVWGVVRDLKVYENTCRNTWHAAIATHSDVDTVEVYRNSLFGCAFGVNPRERNVSVHDNTMINCGQAVYLTARPRDVSIIRNKAVGCTGSFLATSFAGDRDITGLTIEDNEVIRCGGGITLAMFTPASGHRRFSIKNNKFRQVAGAGGSQALIRVMGGSLVDSTISYNEAEDCTGVSGISLDGGSTRLQLLGNNMWDVDGNSFVTLVTGGAYTNCFGKGNVVKTNGWAGNANMTNGASIIADNAFF